ncbi:hypothetical protein ABFS82_01G080100 [Erythranthe guttata]|uniref:RanBD1 domain-containing protein n=1 Tax=Erythranthe guttata TaxID=4155 RepID=A0A022RFM7_ERYGU|nr:PREDICTED: uncharacterized protein LOC105956188 [Erythranthe guttata]EYU38996.1 hypothetical protein MIMGU_mgv1a008108mg [Erythranthe guttata]|eukprot:XP_012835482.1 PREDICTED: uncharacterized protein LOC105956188 [Erythranthe guttata]
MRGTKRSAISDSTPIFNNSNDSFMQSKRVTMGSPFDPQKAEPSIRQPPLDTQRAESSKQHVRALNTQFASWVQAQLQNHPDELWEDGVQDYLNHATSIMVKFSDVVNWLKATAAKGGSLGELRSDDAQTKPASEIAKNSFKLFMDKPAIPTGTTTSFPPATTTSFTTATTSSFTTATTSSFPTATAANVPAATTPSFGTSWKPGGLFNNNTPFTFGGSQVSIFGNANAVPSSDGASNEADGEDDVEQPSSPSVKKSQEKGIIVVHEVKCKLYVKSTDPTDKDTWKDKGMGQLSIKCNEGISKGTKESKPTIIIRNDVGKVLLNALLYPGIKTNMQKNSVVTIFHTSADGESNDKVVARTFLMKTKNEEDRNKLAASIKEYAPAV